mgnify:CR=1 FL=1
MVMTKIADDRIALVKIIVEYDLMEEKVTIESNITPFEYCSKMSLTDQYDFLLMGYGMLDVEESSLDVDDYISFQESLDIKVLIDERSIVNLN